MNKILVTILFTLTSAFMAMADVDAAKRMYNQGDYDGAINALRPIVKKTPKDAAANYYLGAALYKKGELQGAIAPLKVAEDANWSAAARDLAEINLKVYNFDAASAHIGRWEEILNKQKAPYPENLNQMRDRILMAKNMLERVERIQVISKFEVDSAEFFKSYMLSPAAGQLLTALYLPEEYAAAEPRVIYEPQSGKELFWGMPDDDGNITLVVADVLDDGTLTQPVSIGPEINDGNDADFPFMLDDGFTIYYAAKGNGSIGGYDIFMTRRDADGALLQPQNIGMPYNSPYNDYMLVIDNERNIGWFVSDRERIPGKVTVYTFVPSAMRVNYDPDNEKINDYALLRDTEMTDDLEARVNTGDTGIIDDDDDDEFMLPMANGKIYTKLSQFKNPQARQSMRDLLKRMYDLEQMQANLDALRLAYGKGDKKKGAEIVRLEKAVNDASTLIERVTNQIISLEMR